MSPLLTREASGLVGSSCALLFSGLILQNLPLLLMGLVPLSFLIFGLVPAQPRHIELRKSAESIGAVVNDEIEVRVEAEVKDGVGAVTVVDELPKEFELTEGSNFAACWKGRGEKRVVIAYRARCAKRGAYTSKTMWESRHALGLRQTLLGGGGETPITVRPRLLYVRRMRGLATATRIPLPSGAVTRIGPPSMDFRELRRYVSGDPLRFINWKATARNLSRGEAEPVVNEYEREGKQLVWLFLDTSPLMLIGTSVSNAFEHGVEALYSLAHYYLGRGCMVGLCTYGGNEVRVLYPDVGSRQHRRILREILNLEAGGEVSGTLPPAEAGQGGEGAEPAAGGEGGASGRRPGGAERSWVDRLLGIPPPPEAHPGGGGPEGEAEAVPEGREGEGVREEPAGLAAAVERCRRYLMGREPLCVIVSRFTEGNLRAHEEGIRRLSECCGAGGGRRPSIIAVNVIGYGLAAGGEGGKVAAQVLGARDRMLAGRLMGLGVRYVHWDPSEESFASALLRQVVRWRALRAH